MELCLSRTPNRAGCTRRRSKNGGGGGGSGRRLRRRKDTRRARYAPQRPGQPLFAACFDFWDIARILFHFHPACVAEGGRIDACVAGSV